MNTALLVDQVRALVDLSPLAMLATQGPAHVVRYANPAFSALVAPTLGFLGSSLRDEGRRSGNLRVACAIATLDHAYTNGVPACELDLALLLRHASASRFPSLVWPILNADGLPDGLFIQPRAAPSVAESQRLDEAAAHELRIVNERLLVAGLNAQAQAEAQLALRAEAEAAVSMRDEFISVAAHELRTPVTGIKTSAQLALRIMRDTTPEIQRTAHYLRAIVGGSDRLVLLINDLMDVSRMRSGELLLRLAPVDLGSLMNSVAQRYLEIGVKSHSVRIDVPSSPLILTADGARLEQVLDNLLSNAVKYSPQGGVIHVSLRETPDGIQLTVTDEGIGLPPGSHERIFEPFGRAPNATQQGLPGMGLGLHICRRIAEAHGGRMWAESEGEGRGMTVGVWLPLTNRHSGC